MLALTNKRKEMTLRSTNKVNNPISRLHTERYKVSLLLARNIKRGADTRRHECKANSMFSLAIIIQVDNATCTKITLHGTALQEAGL